MNQPVSKNPTIAVIEDDDDLLANLLLSLRSKGYNAWGVSSAEAFYRERTVSPADIVLIDLGLPGEDGLSAIRHLRRGSDIGIIVVTACGGMENRIAGLEAGADHYFVKPIDFRELLATVDTLWRRVNDKQFFTPPRPQHSPHTGTWSLNAADGNLHLPDGRTLSLTQREYELLNCLMATPGSLLSKSALHLYLFPRLDETDNHRIDVILSRLRQKAESQLGLNLPIRTVFGRGFAFVGNPQKTAPDD